MATSLPGEAMETLKMKIFMLKKENTDEGDKVKIAEKEKSEANARLQEAEKKIKELSKQIHSRYSLILREIYPSPSNPINPPGNCCWMTTQTDYRRTST